MIFASDNWAPAHPAIIDAIALANAGAAPAYGGDALTKRVEEKFAQIFDHDVAVYFVATGGAANALALAQIAPPWGMILCHEESHIQMDECGAPEFFTQGAKLLPLPGGHGKITHNALAHALAMFPERPPHGMPAKALSLSQATECGAVYAPEEIAELSSLAHAAGLKVHMDGARFANALATLQCTAAEASWRAGVDVLSFGATKNGCLAAEAVVFFDRQLADQFIYRRKRGGHLFSKSRYIAAQFDAYFEGGLWLEMARHANAMARRLAEGLDANGALIRHPVEANAVFVTFPPGVADRLLAAGATFYPWIAPGHPPADDVKRLVCSWATGEADVDAFLAALSDARR
jgi:threonine aldolase